jgi:hypothetical protein
MRLIHLIEGMPLSLARKAMGWTNGETPHQDIFDRNRSRTKNGKKDRIYFPLKVGEGVPDKSEFGTANKILSFIHNPYGSVWPLFPEVTEDCRRYPETMLASLTQQAQDHYLQGLVRVKSDGTKVRTVRIGKLLQHQILVFRKLVEMGELEPNVYLRTIGARTALAKELLEQALAMKQLYDTDSLRNGTKLGKDRLWVVISRHPYDVASMSTGRGWTSCTNLDGEKNSPEAKYVPLYVEHKSLIAYLIKKGDWNIQQPVSRIMINVHTSKSGQMILVPSEDTYGFASDIFEEFVKKWCHQMNIKKPDGAYASSTTAQYPSAYEKYRGNYRRISRDDFNLS